MSETTTPTRQVDGRTIPSAGTWQVDPTHSSVEFVARHLVVTKVRGRFADWSAELVIGERPEDSRVAVTIQAASFSTGDENRDGHVISPDFLDVGNFPTITFTTTSVAAGSGDRWDVVGDLTIHGVTKAVTLAVEFGGAAQDPWGNTKAGFSASTEIDREDFGLTWNQTLETGGVLISKNIKIEIEVQAVQG